MGYTLKRRKSVQWQEKSYEGMKDVCISRRNLRKKRVGFEEVRDLRGYGEIAEYGLERSVYGGKRNLENERKIHIIE